MKIVLDGLERQVLLALLLLLSGVFIKVFKIDVAQSVE